MFSEDFFEKLVCETFDAVEKKQELKVVNMFWVDEISCYRLRFRNQCIDFPASMTFFKLLEREKKYLLDHDRDEDLLFSILSTFFNLKESEAICLCHNGREIELVIGPRESLSFYLYQSDFSVELAA